MEGRWSKALLCTGIRAPLHHLHSAASSLGQQSAAVVSVMEVVLFMIGARGSADMLS